MQVEICLHDFIPGVTQFIAFDQVDYAKVALLYRILSDYGYVYRTRIIDIRKLECVNVDNVQKQIDKFNREEDGYERFKTAVSSFEDIEEKFREVKD